MFSGRVSELVGKDNIDGQGTKTGVLPLAGSDDRCRVCHEYSETVNIWLLVVEF